MSDRSRKDLSPFSQNGATRIAELEAELTALRHPENILVYRQAHEQLIEVAIAAQAVVERPMPTGNASCTTEIEHIRQLLTEVLP